MRVYDSHNVLTFSKTTGKFGGLSNMSGDYALFVNEIYIPTVEALYQACKFSLYPSIQQSIISQSNPMKAKTISRAYQSYVRQDWDVIKVHIMEWCLKVKLAQNWNTFGNLLDETGDAIIVEYSTKDHVWGAMPRGDGKLEGENILGRLLMKLRQDYLRKGIILKEVNPPMVAGMMLFNIPIGKIYSPDYYLLEL